MNDMEPSTQPPLSATYYRVFSVLVRLVEENALAMEQLLDARPTALTSQVLVADVSAAEAARLRTTLGALRAETAAFHARYTLATRPESLRHLIATKAALLWELLEDSRSTRLCGYGPLEATQAQDLDATVNRLLALANQLALPNILVGE